MREARASSRWAHFANMGLGAWLVTSSPMLAYGDAAMVWNDIASGAAVMILALLSLSGRMSWARFATAPPGPGSCSRRWCSGRRVRRPISTIPWSARS